MNSMHERPCAGGNPSAFDLFERTMKDGSGQSITPRLLRDVLPLHPVLTEWLELGVEVLNPACGRGHALNLLARRFPYSRFIGYEADPALIRVARMEAAESQSGNIRFVRKDPSWFLDTGVFDLVLTFDALDRPDPEGLFANSHRALRPGGLFLMHASCRPDPGPPRSWPARSSPHTEISPREGLSIGESRGERIEIHEARKRLIDAGFEKIGIHESFPDAHNLYAISRKPERGCD